MEIVVCASISSLTIRRCSVETSSTGTPPRATIRSPIRTPARRDDAGRHRAAEAVRIADRDYELPDAQPFGVAELGRHEVAALCAQQREIRERIGADQLEAELAAVREGGAPAPVAAGDDVR